MCHILRYMIKSSAQQDHSIMKLLGYKYSCFKCSSEVSSRTYMCEVAASNYIDQESMQTHEKPACYLPQVMQDFEDLLNQPIKIHNMDKYQRKILTKVQEHQSHKMRPKKQQKLDEKAKKAPVVDTKDLPVLNHVFADGIDFMLSDISLIPCVHNYLLRYFTQTEIRERTPLITQWYDRIQKVNGVLEAFELCKVEVFSFRPATSRDFKISKMDGDYQLLEYKKGKRQPHQKPTKPLTIKRDLKQVLQKTGTDVTFDKYDVTEINLDWENFPDETHPCTGELTTLRARRKCQQIENLVHGVRKVCKHGDTIVEFCCGGGHVGIVLAYLMPECTVVLLDNKEESLKRAHSRVEKLKLKNVVIYHTNLGYYTGSFDVGVALHACGVATDMCLHKCFHSNASYVMSPCCYGKINKTDDISYPQSKNYQSNEISYDELKLLGQAGDQTCWDFNKQQAIEGKMCMGLVDKDRNSAAEDRGYKTTLNTMVPLECTPKNNMIVGKSSR